MTATPAPRRLLITGFGAFPGVPANPSELVVERLRARGWSPEGVAARYAILPTAWSGASQALQAARAEFEPAAVLLTGVSGSARAFRMESRAHNRAATASPDAEGRSHPTAHISDAGPKLLRATAPVRAAVNAIRAEGLPAVASFDCGDYLCNHTLYRLLEAPGASGPLGFLHLPGLGGRFSLDDLERAVKAVAGAMAVAIGPPRALRG